MEYITSKITLERFLTLLSFDTALLKTMSPEELTALKDDYLLIRTYFQSELGKPYTKMFRNSVIGKCSSLNGVILKHCQ